MSIGETHRPPTLSMSSIRPDVDVGAVLAALEAVAGGEPVAAHAALGLLVLVPVEGRARSRRGPRGRRPPGPRARARPRRRCAARSPAPAARSCPARPAPGRFEQKMCSISVEPMPSMMSSPKRSLPALERLRRQRLGGRDAEAHGVERAVGRLVAHEQRRRAPGTEKNTRRPVLAQRREDRRRASVGPAHAAPRWRRTRAGTSARCPARRRGRASWSRR